MNDYPGGIIFWIPHFCKLARPLGRGSILMVSIIREPSLKRPGVNALGDLPKFLGRLLWRSEGIGFISLGERHPQVKAGFHHPHYSAYCLV
jgi:hypothetical protein